MRELNVGDTRELRRFGIGVGVAVVGVFWLLLPWWRSAPRPMWALAAGLALVALGLASPRFVYPLYRAWRPVARVLGIINAWLLLGLVYVVVIVPVGCLLRRAGRLEYRTGFDPRAATYRISVERTARTKLEEPF
jgi:hypothetical protein